MLLVNTEVVTICHAVSKRQNHLLKSAEASCDPKRWWYLMLGCTEWWMWSSLSICCSTVVIPGWCKWQGCCWMKFHLKLVLGFLWNVTKTWIEKKKKRNEQLIISLLKLKYLFISNLNYVYIGMQLKHASLWQLNRLLSFDCLLQSRFSIPLASIPLIAFSMLFFETISYFFIFCAKFMPKLDFSFVLLTLSCQTWLFFMHFNIVRYFFHTKFHENISWDT